MPKSTTPKKPSKPHADFPRFPHASGQWATKICGKMGCFGKWADGLNGEATMKSYLGDKDALLAVKSGL